MPCAQFMMGCYEDELKRPIRNLVNGQLLRTILIQVRVAGRHAGSTALHGKAVYADQLFICKSCTSLQNKLDSGGY